MAQHFREGRAKSSRVFGERLRALRTARGYSVQKMADHLGVPRSTYREWEYGRTIQGQPYAQIAELLGISLAELLTGRKPRFAEVIGRIAVLENTLREIRHELGSLD